MTYKESVEYRKPHDNIIGKPSVLKGIPHNINYLLIAPKERDFKDRVAVLDECRYKPIDNETALKNLGFFNDNLDVYVICEIGNIPYEISLYDYLAEAGIH